MLRDPGIELDGFSCNLHIPVISCVPTERDVADIRSKPVTQPPLSHSIVALAFFFANAAAFLHASIATSALALSTNTSTALAPLFRIPSPSTCGNRSSGSSSSPSASLFRLRFFPRDCTAVAPLAACAPPSLDLAGVLPTGPLIMSRASNSTRSIRVPPR